MVVPGTVIIGGTFKSPELHAFPKHELLKTLLLFLRPWAPTSMSVKQNFASATFHGFCNYSRKIRRLVGISCYNVSRRCFLYN